MIRAALRMWHRTVRAADDDHVPQLARRLLKILHAPTYVDGSPTKAYLVELEDDVVESGPRTPVGVTVDCLRRYDSGGLTKEAAIGEVEATVRGW